jgi:hypothetical protein
MIVRTTKRRSFEKDISLEECRAHDPAGRAFVGVVVLRGYGGQLFGWHGGLCASVLPGNRAWRNVGRRGSPYSRCACCGWEGTVVRLRERGHLFPDEGRIERIVLDLRPRSLAVRTTSLRKVIALFGEPAYWSSSSSEDSNIVITVYYPEKGLAFIVNGGGQGSSIEPGARVALAIFLPPSDAALMAASFFSGDAGGSALSNFRIWRGYGAVEP